MISNHVIGELWLPQSDWLSAFILFAFSLLVGSFLNVVIYRLPVMMQRQWKQSVLDYLREHKLSLTSPINEDTDRFNLAVPRSACGHCHQQIAWYDNIPVLSYLLLRGRCRACGTHYSYRYAAVELMTGVVGAFLGWHFGISFESLGLLLSSWFLIALIFIDIDHQLLPDDLTLPLVWLGLLYNLMLGNTTDALLGAVFGYGSLWLVFWLFKLATGKEGMGYGDFKLLAAIGAWGGYQVLPLTILGSSLVGAIFGIAMIALRKQNSSQPMPFGPYLAIAGWIALIWGDQITHYYLQIAGL